jgi:hypothetical protein
VLTGSCVKQQSLLATYTLEQGRTCGGRPVYRHATKDQVLAFFSGFWRIQKNESVGTSRGRMNVKDSALHPADITGVWQENTSWQDSSWLDAPTVKVLDVADVLSAAPEGVVLTGSCVKQQSLLATYTLEQGRTCGGRPVYRHATKDQALAFSSGSWHIQKNKRVGTSRGRWMNVKDSALHPADITGVWREYGGEVISWLDAPTAKALDVADVLHVALAKATDDAGAAGSKKRKRAAGGGTGDAKRLKATLALRVASMDGSALDLDDVPEAATVLYVKQQVVEQCQLQLPNVQIFAEGVEERLADNVALRSIDFDEQEKPTLFLLVTELSAEELKAQRTVLVQKHKAALQQHAREKKVLDDLMRRQHAREKKGFDDLIREMGRSRGRVS